MEIFSVSADALVPLMDRVRKFEMERYEEYLHSLLLSVMTELSDFVPSEGGVLLMDDPARKREGRKEVELTYIASFGSGTESLPGKRTPATGGTLGEAYMLGKSSVRKSEKRSPLVIDRVHFPRPIDTVITIPIKIEATVVGVMVLFNKKDPVGYTLRDFKLAEIFAAYISTSVQNAIDARKSQELSKRDDLTGLFNDRFFHRQLEIEINRADERRYPLALLFMDLDHFKAVNDQHGHLVGSQTLREIGFILREAVEQENATLARYGGDEYVIILPGIDLDRAMDIAERIRIMIAQKMFMIDQGEHDGSFINFKGLITISIGVASLRDHVPAGGTTKERKNFFIRQADVAMYRAKEHGKNFVCAAEPPNPTER